MMISVDKALEIILSSIPLIKESERVTLFEAFGRVLAEDITAPANVPPENNSAMDGYAVIHADISSAEAPSFKLKVDEEIRAGQNNEGKLLKSGYAIRIMTGAPLPEGADVVVPFEDTDEKNGIVTIAAHFEKYDNIRFAGEDIKKGETVLKKGTRLDSAEIGLLASMNLPEITVIKKPEVAILSTGDEILEVGSENPGEKIINSNAYVLYSEIKKYGGNPHYAGIVRDKKSDVFNRFSELLKYDVIISSGGVSMGKYDFIPDVLRELGIDLKIQKILMKPGKPVVFGTKGEKIFFGLPGNPVSVMVSFQRFVRPALLKMSGAQKIEKPVVHAIAEEDLFKKEGRRYFLRGHYTIKNGEFYVKSTGPQGSGILTSMSSSNCLIILHEDTEIVKAGEKVEIELIRHGEI
ncbi:MAG TPA: molybdopterin molybdotransferase MoeA [Spirochaetota bacterium]|nr:molybdopterin molybdotransferase MoeA [Spirochaetota bacterium]HPF05666.1 molybdopterin molybdotransferase MoeA [Spirochaetota bacterium]HPJ42251.1 molybdopterin molybdotransferase MoeA [Spirochaetota bacterium]HPR36742.1 molybdopterin molybdotransferase MoeA [Spirochaetota bacterium]HRX47047.1 molybdopterin molybdotransferase MoeA [Spirochaetota bacterium]